MCQCEQQGCDWLGNARVSETSKQAYCDNAECTRQKQDWRQVTSVKDCQFGGEWTRQKVDNTSGSGGSVVFRVPWSAERSQTVLQAWKLAGEKRQQDVAGSLRSVSCLHARDAVPPVHESV